MSPRRAGRYVGVDVVDLDHPRCAGKHRDSRFVHRILSASEREIFSASSDHAAALWRLWAAKEAAFKVVSKLGSNPPAFVHSGFRVELEIPPMPASFGTVTWRDTVVSVHWHERPGRVAALGWNGDADQAVEWGWGAETELDPDPSAPLESLLARLTERERPPVHSRPSALVRIAARSAAARALGVEEARVEVVCPEGPMGRTPPEVLLDGSPAAADVSLSHHGRWLAWAVRLAQPGPIQAPADE